MQALGGAATSVVLRCSLGHHVLPPWHVFSASIPHLPNFLHPPLRFRWHSLWHPIWQLPVSFLALFNFAPSLCAPLVPLLDPPLDSPFASSPNNGMFLRTPGFLGSKILSFPALNPVRTNQCCTLPPLLCATLQIELHMANMRRVAFAEIRGAEWTSQRKSEISEASARLGYGAGVWVWKVQLAGVLHGLARVCPTKLAESLFSRTLQDSVCLLAALYLGLSPSPAWHPRFAADCQAVLATVLSYCNKMPTVSCARSVCQAGM